MQRPLFAALLSLSFLLACSKAEALTEAELEAASCATEIRSGLIVVPPP